jgi:hypothetical protein
MLAGFISLIFLAIIPVDGFKSDYLATASISLAEEFVKLLALLFMIGLVVSLSKFKHYIYLSIAFGLSFSLFELFLVLVSHSSLLNYTFFLTTLIHVITSVLLGILVYYYHNQRKLSTKLVLLFVLAFFIHLCYNLVVLKFN